MSKPTRSPFYRYFSHGKCYVHFQEVRNEFSDGLEMRGANQLLRLNGNGAVVKINLKISVVYVTPS